MTTRWVTVPAPKSDPGLSGLFPNELHVIWCKDEADFGVGFGKWLAVDYLP